MIDISLADRIQRYESSTVILLDSIVICRLDGVGFSKLGFVKPSDRAFELSMVEVAHDLSCRFHPRIVYVGSDEISMAWLCNANQEPPFGGSVQKISSIMAAFATKKMGLPFDCRTFGVPNLAEVINYFIYRERSIQKNAVQMVARHQLGHAAIQGKSTVELRSVVTMDYSHYFTYGQYVVPEEMVLMPFQQKWDVFAKHDKMRSPESRYIQYEIQS